MSLDPVILDKLTEDGGLPIGFVHATVAPKAGRDILAQGGQFARASYPRLAPSLPMPMPGKSFVAGAALTIPGSSYHGYIRRTVTNSTHMLVLTDSTTQFGKFDGTTMTAVTHGFSGRGSDAYYANGVWIIVGTFGVIRSTDLITFTRAYTPGGNDRCCAVMWANNTWVVVVAYAPNNDTTNTTYYGEMYAISSTDNGVTFSAKFKIQDDGTYALNYGSVRINAKYIFLRYSGGRWYLFYNIFYEASGYYFVSQMMRCWNLNQTPIYSATNTNTVSMTTGQINYAQGNLIVGAELGLDGTIWVFSTSPSDGWLTGIRWSILPGGNARSFSNGGVETWTGNTFASYGYAYGLNQYSDMSGYEWGNICVLDNAMIVTVTGRENYMISDSKLQANATYTNAGLNNAFGVTLEWIGKGPKGFVFFSGRTNTPNNYRDDYTVNTAPFFLVPTIPAFANGVNQYIRGN